MAEYEIQRDVNKALEWLSQAKEHAYKGVDELYKDIKKSAETPVSPKQANKPVTPKPSERSENQSGGAVLIAYGLLAALVLFFLYRDEGSWLRRWFREKSRYSIRARSISNHNVEDGDQSR